MLNIYIKFPVFRNGHYSVGGTVEGEGKMRERGVFPKFGPPLFISIYSIGRVEWLENPNNYVIFWPSAVKFPHTPLQQVKLWSGQGFLFLGSYWGDGNPGCE
jgi:hypothetical protein